MPAPIKGRNRKYDVFEKALLAQQRELSARIQGRLNEVSVEREPDDEAAQAIYSVTRDMSAATLERERKTLAEIEAALVRIRKGEYGTCEACGVAIPDARLNALPQARQCVPCASRGSFSSVSDYLRMRAAS
jgi:DnaK suppressor protein